MFSVSFLEPWGSFLEARDLIFEVLVVFGNIFGAENEKANDNPGPERDFGRFLEGQKWSENMFFSNIDFFYEKTWFVENRAGALVKAIILKGQGRFRRSSKPTKTTKIMKKSSQKCMKKARSKNMKNHEKTEKHEKQGPLRNTVYKLKLRFSPIAHRKN